MTLTYTYDGNALTHDVSPTSLSIPQSGYRGALASGDLTIEDPDADLTLVGLRPFTIEESACSSPRLWTGYVAERGISRQGHEQLYTAGASRAHKVQLFDLNAVFKFRPISGSDGKRPVETWDARLAWILGSDYLSGLIQDTGYLVSITRNMSAADYTDRYPLDVLNELADRTQKPLNYYAWWDAGAGTPAVSLFFDYFDAFTDQSTLSISNVAADVDLSTVFPPFIDAEQKRSPEDVWSEVIVKYADDKRVFLSNAGTEGAFLRRGTVVDRPYIGKASTASDEANLFLSAHSAERDVITCTVRLPRDKAGLIRAGQAIDVKFSHLPGFESFTTCIVAQCAPTPVNDYAREYDLVLELVAPRPAATEGGGGGACDEELNELYGTVTDGGGDRTFDNPTNANDGSDLTIARRGAFVGDTGLTSILETDLASARQVTAIYLLMGPTSSMNNNWQAGYSSNGSDWTSVGYGTETITGPGKGFYTWAFTAVTARYWRILHTTTAGPFQNSLEVLTWEITGCDPDPEATELDPPMNADIVSETVNETPNGTTTVFTVDNPYLPGTLSVFVDNLDQTLAVTESDPAAGEFTLGFAPVAGEVVTATYKVG